MRITKIITTGYSLDEMASLRTDIKEMQGSQQGENTLRAPKSPAELKRAATEELSLQGKGSTLCAQRKQATPF